MKAVGSIFILLVVFQMASAHGQNGGSRKAITQNLKAVQYREKLTEINNEILVDIRTPREWKSGMMKDALGVNFFDHFKENIDKLDKTRPVFIYCATGHRSPFAMREMKKLGFTEIYNLKGGLRKWKKANLPVESTAS